MVQLEPQPATPKLNLQGRNGLYWGHRRPVVSIFALAHGEGSLFCRHVLDAKVEEFGKPQTGPLEERGPEVGLDGCVLEETLHLVSGAEAENALGLLSAHDTGTLGHFNAQHVVVQIDEGV